jgi:SAM-dependent methyltransferase
MPATDLYGQVQRRLRTARMRAFVEAFGVTADTRILDVGGDGFNWGLVDVRPRVTVLNVEPPTEPLPDGMDCVIGDGCALPFADQSFDIVYSNSVIEHLGTRARQERFAREVQRVGRTYYVQTPNRWFPFEPHLITPFVHYLPHRWQRAVYPYTVWGLVFRPTVAEMDANYEQIRLLGRREFASLFPDAALHTERVAALAKSFVAQRTAPRGAS